MPRNEFSDLYHEVGPDNVGGMGGEPACTVTLFKQTDSDPQPSPDAAPVQQDHAILPASQQQHTAPAQDSSAAPATASATASFAQSNGPAALEQQTTAEPQASILIQQNGSSEYRTGRSTYRIVDQIDCGPHKMVAFGQQQQILLGLSDDIDCAAVMFTSQASALVAEHLHSVPALAYVTAGKTGHMLIQNPSTPIAMHHQAFTFMIVAAPRAVNRQANLGCLCS